MKGIAKHTERIIEPVSKLDCLKGWTLAGGTALAIQLGHRLSEDLDFMRWQTRRDERMDVDWPTIRRQLESGMALSKAAISVLKQASLPSCLMVLIILSLRT